jgi:putative endonuclease
MRRQFKEYYVYILSNLTKRLYVGITNNLERRMYEHKNKHADGFTAKYNLTRLVYFEDYKYVLDAIATEKQLKGWLRERKIALVESQNPNWDDLSEFWFPVKTDSSTTSEYGLRSE